MKILHLLALSLLTCTSALFSQGFTNIAIRSEARQHFIENFQTTEPAIGWTGNSSSGDAGATSSAFRAAMFDQINYFRVQAGVQEISENLEQSAKAQEAAFMMSVNNQLNHTPPENWTFYSEDGKEAAGNSNLYLAVNGIKAIEGYMDDPGAYNTQVGHRNLILIPETLTMGTGNVPNNAGHSKANALWVIPSTWPQRATRSPFNCWPPANGYTPYQVIYPRWSFKSEGADLSNASVQMWDAAGQPIALTIEHKPVSNWFSYPLVWIPDVEASLYNQARSAPTEDEWYRVRISGIEGTGPETVEYTVIIFDPATESSQQQTINYHLAKDDGSISVNWTTPDLTAWTLQQSENLVSWTATDLEILYDGFSAQMTVPTQSSAPIESDQPDAPTQLFFRLAR